MVFILLVQNIIWHIFTCKCKSCMMEKNHKFTLKLYTCSLTVVTVLCRTLVVVMGLVIPVTVKKWLDKSRLNFEHCLPFELRKRYGLLVVGLIDLTYLSSQRFSRWSITMHASPCVVKVLW